MALRIRKDRKTIVCAAKSKPEEGDCYIDDSVHYVLAVEIGILHSHTNEGDTWYFDLSELIPTGDNKMNPEPFTEKELDVIRMRAMYLARKKGCGILLQRKFWALADAVNNLSTGTTMSEFVPEEEEQPT